MSERGRNGMEYFAAPIANSFYENRNLPLVRMVVLALAWLSLIVPAQQFKYELFYGLSGLLLAYISIEIYSLPRNPLATRFLNPIVLGSIGTFLLSMGGGLNFFVFAKDYSKLDFSFIAPAVNGDFGYVVYAMTLSITAAVVTWSTFYSRFGEKLFLSYNSVIPSSTFLRGEFDTKRLLFIVIASMLIRYFIFEQGLHGRAVAASNLASGGGYAVGTEYRHLGKLGYVALALTFIAHARHPTSTTAGLRWLVLIYEVLFGFLEGARSAIVFPFLIAFVTQSYVERRVAKSFIWLTFFAVIFAMSFGNEFKAYTSVSGYQEEMGVLDLVADFAGERSRYAELQTQNESLQAFAQQFARNKSKVAECSAALQFADTSSSNWADWFQSSARREFLVAPINGLLPRSVTGFRLQPWGLAFKNHVLHRNTNAVYSIAFSPIAFCYFAGHVFGVVLGACFYGIALRFALHIVGLGDLGFLMFLALMSRLFDVHTNAPELIIGHVRFLIYLPICFWFLSRRQGEQH